MHSLKRRKRERDRDRKGGVVETLVTKERSLQSGIPQHQSEAGRGSVINNQTQDATLTPFPAAGEPLTGLNTTAFSAQLCIDGRC